MINDFIYYTIDRVNLPSSHSWSSSSESWLPREIFSDSFNRFLVGGDVMFDVVAAVAAIVAVVLLIDDAPSVREG